jgi:hypothetical protein
VRFQTWPADEVARVIASTDGMVDNFDAVVTLDDSLLAPRLAEAAQRPGNDDTAFVDIGLVAGAMPGGPQTAVTPPLWRRLAEEPTGRHARTSRSASALRRLLRSVAPVTGSPAGPPPTVPPPLQIPMPGRPTPPPPWGGPGPAPARRSSPEPQVPDPGVAPGSADLVVPRVPPCPPPADVRWRRSERGLEISWTPVAAADSYTVQLCREPTFAAPLDYSTKLPTFSVPPMPMPIFVRVRGLTDAVPGPWGPKYRLDEQSASRVNGAHRGPQVNRPPQVNGVAFRGLDPADLDGASHGDPAASPRSGPEPTGLHSADRDPSGPSASGRDEPTGSGQR